MKRNEVIATILVSIVFVVLAAVLVWAIFERSADAMDAGRFVNICVSLTSVLTLMVMIYAVYMMRGEESADKRYEEYALKRKEEESKGKL
jgi:membrane protein involved in colicin uptake